MDPGKRAEVTDRRQWMDSVLRRGAAGGILVLAGCLALKRGSQGCARWTSTCRSCGILAHCELPAARAARDISSPEEQT